MAAQEAYEFAGFALDVTERRLQEGERIVPLAPKAFDLLVVLVRRAGRLVTKQDLLDLAWPDAHVEEGILAVHVSNLRKALGDREADHRLIETVPRSGYRFTRATSRGARRRRIGFRCAGPSGCCRRNRLSMNSLAADARTCSQRP